MTNRIIYFISLVVTFILLITTFILVRFVEEEKNENTHLYISPDVDIIIEIHPITFFKEALLSPLFDNDLTSEDRSIFQTDRELIPSEPTGISFLSPFYLTRRKIKKKTLYALYFSLNSAEDFAVFSKKQKKSNSPFVFYHFHSTGVVLFSESISSKDLHEIIRSDFDHSMNKSIDFKASDSHQRNSPLKIYSIEEGKINESVHLSYQPTSNTIDFSGKIAFSPPVIMNKINPNKEGIYLSCALSNDIKEYLFPSIEPYISEKNWNHIKGIELNYAGVTINPKTRQPEPQLNIHIHHTSDSLFNPLDRLPQQWIKTNDKTDTVTIAGNMQFVCRKSIGLFTIENLEYTWREKSKPTTWEIKGKPSTLFAIDEPFKSMALALDPKLRSLNRFVEQMNYLHSTAQPQENNLSIAQEIEFKSGVNPYFEFFYFLRKMGD